MRLFLESTSARFRLLLLFFLFLLGLTLATLLVALMRFVPFVNEDGGMTMIYLTTTIQSILVIAAPPILLSYLTERSPFNFLKLTLKKNIGRDLLFALTIYLVSYPFVSLVGQLNSRMTLPKALHEVEAVMRSMEDAAMETTQQILSMTSIGGVFLNLLIVALLAAVTEELFFRGALQQLLQKWIGNVHTGIWLTAVIFSVIHFQFYGFLPRMILGALLGYLFYYSNNLWVPIFFHFLNNATVILLNLFWGDAVWFRELDALTITPLYVTVAIICVLSVLLLFRVYRKKNYNSSFNHSIQ